MPVILGLLGLLSATVIVIWRMRMAADATREIVSAVDDVRGSIRYWFFRRANNKHPLELLDDPREAAVAWMVAIAQDDGVVSEAELNEIRKLMASPLRVDNPVETLARARWAVRDLKNLDACAGKLAPLFRRKLNLAERAEFLDMLQQVARIDGDISPAHAALLTRWRQDLLRQ